MKRLALFGAVAAAFLLLAGSAFAGGMMGDKDCPMKDKKRAQQASLEQVVEEGGIQATRIGYTQSAAGENVLFQNHIGCLEQCQQQFESCMSSADGPTEEFRCGEKRTACTLGCDDDNYQE